MLLLVLLHIGVFAFCCSGATFIWEISTQEVELDFDDIDLPPSVSLLLRYKHNNCIIGDKTFFSASPFSASASGSTLATSGRTWSPLKIGGYTVWCI